MKTVKSKIDCFLKPKSHLTPLKNEFINKNISKLGSVSYKNLRKKNKGESTNGEEGSRINLKVSTSIRAKKTPFYGHLRMKSGLQKRAIS